MLIDLRPTPLDHPDASALIVLLQAHYLEIYGGHDDTPHAAAEFVPPRGYFVVAYVDDVAVACGGWRARDGGDDDEALRDGDAEIKRMFVLVSHRGRGYARAVLAELERTAAAAGRRRAVLETGTSQPEAIGLYTSAGYVRTATFGIYRESPRSRCFAKRLEAGPPCVPDRYLASVSPRPPVGQTRSAVAGITQSAKDASADDGAAEGGHP
jgi:ribosomal protein S18 acetylase RimI-like enzyme